MKNNVFFFNIRFIFFIIITLLISIACSITILNKNTEDNWSIPAYCQDTVIKVVETTNGGVQERPEPIGSVLYLNPAGIKTESDIQFDNTIHLTQTAIRYMEVSGLAIPDDSGYTDRGYHSVLIKVINEDEDKTNRYSIPVDYTNQRFKGYIYFHRKGFHTIRAYRLPNDYLYPKTKGTEYIVQELYTTAKFYVNVIEGIPNQYTNLLPTRCVDCGIKSIQDYSDRITYSITNDLEKAKKIYEFLVFGDNEGDFIYKYYDEIYPGYLDTQWRQIFIASQFLRMRMGVCQEFAELYAALARAAGLNVKRYRGDKPDFSVSHQWNIIYVNSKWYKLDATWGNRYRSSSWKTYAEFYPEFDSVKFYSEHENTYCSNSYSWY